MLERSITIQKAANVKIKARQQFNINVSIPKVRKIMKQEMGLTYHIIKKIPIQANSNRCLVLRQQYALKMIELLH